MALPSAFAPDGFSGHPALPQLAARLASAFEADAENDFGHLPFGNFVQRLLQTKVIYAFSPNLIVSSFTQYDTESRQVGVNNRVRWTIRPEADLFIVWNRGWKHGIGDEEGGFAPLSDQFVVKLRWIFRW